VVERALGSPRLPGIMALVWKGPAQRRSERAPGARRQGRRAVAVAVALSLAVACGDDPYEVTVRFATAALRDRARGVEVAIVAACPAPGRLADAPVGPLRELRFRAGEASGELGTLAPGSYGLHARVRDEGCLVYAAGCEPVDLEARRHDTLVVRVDAVDGHGCGDGQRCDDGLCEPGGADADADADEDSDEDADDDLDAEVDAEADAEPDAPDPCVVADHAALQEALYGTACPVITLRDGTYVGQVFVMRSVTLEGTSTAGTILSGDAADPAEVVSIYEDDAVVVLRRLTVTGGFASGQGGGISSVGTLTLDGVVVTGNTAVGATADGGGIYSAGPSLSLLGGSEVTGNTVGCPADDGCCGGVTLRGGGISVQGGDLELGEGSAVRDNRITCDCAAPCTSFGAVTAFGGGVSVEEGDLAIAGASVVDGNAIVLDRDSRLVAQGGGLSVRGDASAALSSSTISANAITLRSLATGEATVQALGGGLSVFCPFLLAEGLRVERNEISVSASELDSTVQGGGVRLGAPVESYPVSFRLVETTVDSNVAGSTCPEGACSATHVAQGGGVYVYLNNTTAELTNEFVVDRCTISNDRVESSGTAVGGGFFARGGETDEFHLVNSTISGNSGLGAVSGIGAAAQGPGTLDLRSVTIHGNGSDSAGTVGGGLNAAAGTAVAMSHTIVAGNEAATCDEVHFASPSLLSGASNLLGAVDAACTLAAGFGFVEGDHALGALADNGGPTLTHAIAAGSAAVDAGAESCTDDDGVALETDQRGAGYPRVAGARCDLGAFELEP
jgi:hypothetical protein